MKNILLIIIIVLLLIYINNRKYKIENFASTDEAIASVASLYNQGMATVSNINVTGNATVAGGSLTLKPGTIDNNGTGAGIKVGGDRMHTYSPESLYILNKSGAVISKEWGGNGNLTVQGNATVQGGTLNFKPGPIGANGTGSGIDSPGDRMHVYSPELLYVLNKSGAIIGREWGGNGNLHVQGNLKVDGIITGNKFQAGIIDDTEKIGWSQREWLQQAKNKGYISKDMPDGTIVPLFAVHPGDKNPDHPNRWMRLSFIVKYGNQGILFNTATSHENWPNPKRNNAREAEWAITL